MPNPDEKNSNWIQESAEDTAIAKVTFADDVVLIAEKEKNVQDNIDIWNETLKKKGDLLCVNSMDFHTILMPVVTGEIKLTLLGASKVILIFDDVSDQTENLAEIGMNQATKLKKIQALF
ncbi:hypothetical protein Trydic_g2776 [Trypoxylus dichotomus]